MHEVGTLRSIWRYPVKALRGEALESVVVREAGLPGDRAAALFIRDGHARVGKTLRGKEHNRLHLVADADDARALASERGIVTELRDEKEHYFDDAPVSLIVDRWLDEVSALVGYVLEPQRFRPNFFVSAAPGFTQSEAELEGTTLACGDVLLRVRYPIGRCVTPTYDLHTGVSDPNVLRRIAQHRNNYLGIYCDVVRGGKVRVRDKLAQIERSSTR